MQLLTVLRTSRIKPRTQCTNVGAITANNNTVLIARFYTISNTFFTCYQAGEAGRNAIFEISHTNEFISEIIFTIQICNYPISICYIIRNVTYMIHILTELFYFKSRFLHCLFYFSDDSFSISTVSILSGFSVGSQLKHRTRQTCGGFRLNTYPNPKTKRKN